MIRKECSQSLIKHYAVVAPSMHSIHLQPPSHDHSHRLQYFQRDMKSPMMINKPTPLNKGTNIARFKRSPIIKLPTDKDDSNQDKLSQQAQERKANLGSTIEYLQSTIPNLLERSFDKSKISPNIHLRICPSQFDEHYLPHLRGHVTYFTACKTIQLFMTSVILSPKVKLHIQSVRVHAGPDPQAMLDDTTKVIVRWSTCPEECPHLSHGDDDNNFHSTSHAHLGAHKWSKLDTLKLFVNNRQQEEMRRGLRLSYLTGVLGKLPSTLMGLTKEKKKLERVISGLFIFELTEDNSQILVHTIENVDVVERFEPEEVDSTLGAFN